MRNLLLLFALIPFFAQGQITKSQVDTRINQKVTTQVKPSDLRNALKYIAQYARQADSTALVAIASAGGGGVTPTSTNTLTNKTMSGGSNTFSAIPQSAITNLTSDLALKAALSSPTFTGTPVLPVGTSVGNVSSTELQFMDGVTSAIQTQLGGKQSTLISGTNIKTINGASLLGSGDISISGGSGLTNVFNIVNYGATDNGDTDDDTPAIQAAINAARAVNGLVLIPSAITKWRILNTINIVPISGQNEVQIDIEAHGRVGNQIVYSGTGNKPVFYIKGLRFAKISGIKVTVPTTIADLQIFDLDTDDPSYSTTHITFKDIHMFMGNGANNVGYRMGHVSGGGADISNIQWENCSVWGNVAGGNAGVIDSQIGWLVEGANTLQNTWIGGFGAFLGKMISNSSRAGSTGTGNGAWYIYGLGTSQNRVEYDFNNSQSYVISGGRYERGRRFMTVTNGNDSPSITVTGVELNDFEPSDNVLFWIDRPCSVVLQNINVLGQQYRTTAYTNAAITLYGGGDGAGVGSLIVDGGSWMASDAFYRYNLNSTKWQVSIRGVGKLNPTTRVRETWMKNRTVAQAPNGTVYSISVNDAGAVTATAD